MSPRVFDGWTPTEVHQHYDADGIYTGHTVVTRESEWDDETRARALRLAEYEDNLCPCGCGHPLEVSTNKQGQFRVEQFKCQVSRAIEIVRRRDRELAEKANKPDGWADGLNYYAVPHDPQ